ncbi:MAG: sugar phosphate isomerase/epimerase family protein [Chloroflexota bacterium]
MTIACCTWALSGIGTPEPNVPEDQILAQLTQIGFDTIDIRPDDFANAPVRTQIHDLNLAISTVGLSFGVPKEVTFSDEDTAIGQKAIDHALRGIDYAVEMGVQNGVYVIPDMDDSVAGLERYGQAMVTLADAAQQHNLPLLIEHFPGRALPTITGTIAFIQSLAHPNIKLLFDIGHAQMSGELEAFNACQIDGADDYLGYVHFDDNDGVGDLHWALCDGLLTIDTMQRTCDAAKQLGYVGPISLEISPVLDDPLDAIQCSWDIMQQLNL